MNIEDLEKEAHAKFAACKKLLIALGDSTRQAIITALIPAGCSGMRVGEITSKTYLSRPAVSHHLKILLDNQVVHLTRVGTKNYYFLKLEGQWPTLLELIEQIESIREIIAQREDNAL